MASEDFDRIVDNFIQGAAHIGEEVKRAAAPLGAFINPRSSQATKEDLEALKARNIRLETRNIRLETQRDDQFDTINDRDRKLREVEGERDALRGQNDDLRAELAALKKPDSGRHEGGNAGAPAS